MKQLYEQKGYPQDRIDKRLRGIAIRQNLTDEWKQRGITKKRDYAILTAEISKATFGITPSEYKKLKKIGEGTYGKVYFGIYEDSELNKQNTQNMKNKQNIQINNLIAIKSISISKDLNVEAVKIQLDEIKSETNIIKKLKHRNIVKYYQTALDKDQNGNYSNNIIL